MQLRDIIKKAAYLKDTKAYEQGKAWTYMPDSWKLLVLTANNIEDERYKDAAFLLPLAQKFMKHKITKYVKPRQRPVAEIAVRSVLKGYTDRIADKPDTVREAVCAILMARDNSYEQIIKAFMKEEEYGSD